MGNIKQTLDQAASELNALATNNAQLEARLLLSLTLNKSMSWLYAWPEKRLDENQQHKFRELVSKRLRGIPIAYLTGEREFWSLPLKVTPDTLIPRPETELLVELALAMGATNCHCLDLGTGSGAIAIALATEHPYWQILATDQSLKALNIAQENANTFNANNIEWQHGSWFAAIPENRQFDLIISNPPYIEENDHHLKEGDVRFEPSSALVAGKNGLDDIKIIIETASDYLKNQGVLMLEHGYQQAPAIQALFAENGFSGISTKKDLADQDRVTLGRK